MLFLGMFQGWAANVDRGRHKHVLGPSTGPRNVFRSLISQPIEQKRVLLNCHNKMFIENNRGSAERW